MRLTILILSVVVITFNACSTNNDLKPISFTEYKQEHWKPGFFINSHFKVLKDGYTDKPEFRPQIINLESTTNSIQTIANKDFFENHKKYFHSFDVSTLINFIYHKNRALVNFAFKPDEFSVRFGYYLLELEKDILYIHLLEAGTGCGGPPVPVFELETPKKKIQ